MHTNSTQVTVDGESEEIIATLKEKYPIGDCEIHPKSYCFSRPGGKDHWLLDHTKLVIWAGAIVSSFHSSRFL